jgi:hypothetical protein
MATVVVADPGTVPGGHGAIAGTVTLTDASSTTYDAPGVRLTLTCGATPDDVRVATSDDRGTFRFHDVLPDRCSIDADLPGFANAAALAVVRAGDTVHVAVHLDIAPVGTGIRVVGPPPGRANRLRDRTRS